MEGTVEIKKTISRTKTFVGVTALMTGVFSFIGALALVLLAIPDELENYTPSVVTPNPPNVVQLPCTEKVIAGDYSVPIPTTHCPKQIDSGELIVKFKSDRPIMELQKYLRSRHGLVSALPNSIIGIGRRNGIKKMMPVFSKDARTKSAARLALDRTYKLTFQRGVNIQNLISQFSQSADVIFAEKNFEYSIAIEENIRQNVASLEKNVPIDDVTWVPDDPMYHSIGSWGQSYDDQWGLKRIDAENAWQLSTGTQDVVVAVIDTGTDITHPDLAGRAWVNSDERPGNGIDDDDNGFIDDVRGWNFATNDAEIIDRHGHGTHVAGIIGATTSNDLGIAGLGWDTTFMTLKGLGDNGGGFSEGLAQSILYAVDNGADIINMSWGSLARSQLISDAIAYAHSQNVVSVAAAGNSGGSVTMFYPASDPSVITVGAWCPSNVTSAYCHSNPEGSRAAFSNFGEKIDVVAPGVDILSLRAAGTDMYKTGSQIVQNQFYRSSGTSMAAPHVSGLVSLLLSLNLRTNPEQVKLIIDAAAEDVGGEGKDPEHGWGLIHAASTLRLANQIQATPKAELILQEERIDWMDENNAQLRFQVRNIGWSQSQATFYKLYSDSTSGLVVAEGSVPSLPPMASANFTISFALTQVPTLRFLLDLDPDNNVTEIEKRNNQLFIAVSLPKLTGWPPDTNYNFTSPLVAADIDNDGTKEIIAGTMSSQEPVFSGNRVFAWHRDGRSVTGWPAPIDGYVFDTEPAVGDTDHDGRQEIYVVTSSPTRIYAWFADGTPIPGWPKIPRLDYLKIEGVALADIDSDGDQEILAGPWAWHSDGSLVSGWPLPDAQYGEISVLSPWAIDDIDDDGQVELFAGAIEYPPSNLINGVAGVYAWRGDGTRVPGWPVATDRVVYAAPAIGDIDGDGLFDIVAVSHGEAGLVHAWHADGSTIAGWPQSITGTSMSSPPIIADIDNDSSPEVIVSNVPSGQTIAAEVYTWRGNGMLAQGWPVAAGISKTTLGVDKLVAADIAGDDKLEIVGPFNEGLFAWDHLGASVPGFPLYTGAVDFTSVTGSPVIVDLNGDRKQDILIGGGSPINWNNSLPPNLLPRSVHAWTSFKVHENADEPWVTSHHDNQRTGRFDSQRPVVSVSNPSANTSVSGSTLTITAIIIDTSVIRSVQFLMDGTNVGSGTLTCSKILDNKRCLAQFTLNLNSLESGNHSIVVRATDVYGNIGRSPVVSFQKASITGGGGRIPIPIEVE